MAANNVVASVAVLIRPITKGFKKNIQDAYKDAVREINPEAPEVSSDGMEESGKKAGNRFSKAFGKWAKRSLAVVGVAAGAAVGAAFVSGFRSAIDQQQGQLVLSGLYGDAEKARETLKGIRGVASGSPIDYSAYQSAAESLAYAGAEGDDAIGVLKNIGKAITAAGGDSSNMDRATDAILKGVNAGKFQLDTLQQLSDAGIPILSGLAEHFGISIEEVNKMASEGKIQLEDVMGVLSNGTGDVFQQMITAGEEASQSFGNQWKIAKDNISVAIGQVMLPLIEMLAPAIQPAADAVVGFVEQIPGMLDGIRDGVQWIKDNIAWIGTLGVSLAIAGAAAWVASGGLTAVGLSIKGVFLSISAGIKSIPVIGWVIAAIGLLVTALVYVFTQTEWGQKVWERVWGAIKTAAAATWEWIRDTLWPGILTVWDAISSGAIWLYENAILPAWNGIRTAISATVDWLVNTAWPFIQSVWNAIADAAIWLWQSVLEPAWNGIKVAVAVAVALILTYIDLLKWYFTSVIAPVAMWLWNNVMQPVWNGIKSAIGAVVDWFQNTAWPLLKQAIDWIAKAFEDFKTGLGIIWDFVKNSIINPVVSWFQNTVWPLIDKVLGWIQMSFEGWKIILGAVWDFVKNRIINPVVSWFRDTAWPIISSVIDSIKTGFNVMRDGIKAAWNFVKDRIIAPVANWFRDTIGPLFDTVTSGVSDAFTTMKDAVKTAFEKLRDAAKAPIRFVVETVVNDALIKNFNKVASKIGVDSLKEVSLPSGFARGGVLPGMSSFRDGDDQLVPMRRGEGVLVSEALRDPTSRSLVHAINSAALQGGTSLASLMGGGFAGGGIFGDVWRGAKSLAGDALDKVLEGVDFVAEAISNPRSMFDKVFNAVIGKIPGAGLVTDMAKGAGTKILDGIVDSVLGSFGPGSDGDIGPIPPGGSRSLGYAQQVARSMGLTMTSHRRGGARTASGYASLHSQGRAMDFSNSSGPTKQMMAFFNAMWPLAPTELLYTPAGSRNRHRSGRMYANTGATARNHNNHVHVGFAGGGVLDQRPTLFDQGGVLPPGLTGVLNATRKPEAVLTNEQLKQLRTLTSRDPVSGDNYNIYPETDKVPELMSELMWAQKTRRRSGKYAHAGR